MSNVKKVTESQVKEAFGKLDRIYSQMPETKGCLENLPVCQGWCCRVQNPQVLKVEFLKIKQKVFREFPEEKLAELLRRSLQNYLTRDFQKGCIFFDRETKLCTIHDSRPWNCYHYGIIPQEEFRERLEKIKEKLSIMAALTVRDQCNKVSTVNEKKVDYDKLWEELLDIEKSLGFNLEDGMNYLTLHDHFLIQTMPESHFKSLQLMRQHSPNPDGKVGEEKEKEQKRLDDQLLKESIFIDNYVKIYLDGMRKKNEENKNLAP